MESLFLKDVPTYFVSKLSSTFSKCKYIFFVALFRDVVNITPAEQSAHFLKRAFAAPSLLNLKQFSSFHPPVSLAGTRLHWGASEHFHVCSKFVSSTLNIHWNELTNASFYINSSGFVFSVNLWNTVRFHYHKAVHQHRINNWQWTDVVLLMTPPSRSAARRLSSRPQL